MFISPVQNAVLVGLLPVPYVRSELRWNGNEIYLHMVGFGSLMIAP